MKIIICGSSKNFFKGTGEYIRQRFPEAEVLSFDNACDVLNKMARDEKCIIITQRYIYTHAKSSKLDGLQFLVPETKLKNPTSRVILCLGEWIIPSIVGISTIVYKHDLKEDAFNEKVHLKIINQQKLMESTAVS